jgi:hypothetical protein
MFKLIKFSAQTIHGNLHCVFFGPLTGAAWDYPHQAVQSLSKWRYDQPVYGEVSCTRDCEAKA